MLNQEIIEVNINKKNKLRQDKEDLNKNGVQRLIEEDRSCASLTS